ncbi:hypothetical protein ANCCAN_25572 [Ancylostoma caninum]|uniref:Uncharacterized protein n=1 Tax=Ancylostoma caninum TaxID=29170 RepID=A0A368F998_ANCCA|nr:hypothetical protein ANCCAN_25572 [Ancylostoma caninum]
MMPVAVLALELFLLHCVVPFTVDDVAVADVPHACTLLCKQGYKCVMVEPPNCIGCQTVPRCVQEGCDTTCVVSCPFVHICVLVETDCCPVPNCRIVNPGGPIQHLSNNSKNSNDTTA